jgi:hypothetical protein
MVPVAAMPAVETIVMKAREATVPSAVEPATVKSGKSTTMEPAAMEPTAMEPTAAVTATPMRSVGEV